MTDQSPRAAEPPVNQTPSKRRSVKPWAISVIAVVAALGLIGGGLAGGIVLQQSKTNPQQVLTAATDGNSPVTAEESTIAAVAEKVAPSVVSIVTETRSSSIYGTASQTAGTGIIVSKDGYVMTNNHVVDGARTISVVDSNGDTYDSVSLIGRDPLNDIAFLKIKANKEFTPAVFGNSASLRTGQQVVAIGNALGQYSNSVTSGIVSGTGRPVTADDANGQAETLTDLIQTDASINPGNSGGPLLNLSGQVVGINTAIVEDANGIGFAIPINATKGVLAEVLATGKVSRAFLGVNYLSITPDVAKQYSLTAKQGAYVNAANNAAAVSAGSPAAKAGFKQGDIITKINDSTVGPQGSLSSIIGQYRPGDNVTITYLRDGQTKTAQVTFSAYTS